MWVTNHESRVTNHGLYGRGCARVAQQKIAGGDYHAPDTSPAQGCACSLLPGIGRLLFGLQARLTTAQGPARHRSRILAAQSLLACSLLPTIARLCPALLGFARNCSALLGFARVKILPLSKWPRTVQPFSEGLTTSAVRGSSRRPPGFYRCGQGQMNPCGERGTFWIAQTGNFRYCVDTPRRGV